MSETFYDKNYSVSVVEDYVDRNNILRLSLVVSKNVHCEDAEIYPTTEMALDR